MEALGLLVLLSIYGNVLSLPRYTEYLIYQVPTVPEASPEYQEAMEYHNIDKDEVEDLAVRKREYHESMSAIASKWAEDNQIFSAVVPLRKHKVVNDLGETLHHREATRKTLPVLFQPAEGISIKPLASRPSFGQEAPSIAEVHAVYSSNGGLLEQPPVVPVVLPNGFLQDTPEVQAAKREHFAAVAKANVKDITAKVNQARVSNSFEY